MDFVSWIESNLERKSEITDQHHAKKSDKIIIKSERETIKSSVQDRFFLHTPVKS